jgi:hypothetical protein
VVVGNPIKVARQFSQQMRLSAARSLSKVLLRARKRDQLPTSAAFNHRAIVERLIPRFPTIMSKIVIRTH